MEEFLPKSSNVAEKKKVMWPKKEVAKVWHILPKVAEKRQKKMFEKLTDFFGETGRKLYWELGSIVNDKNYFTITDQ